MRKLYRISILVLGIALIGGCNTPREQLLSYNRYFEASDFNSAYNFAQKNIKGGKKPDRDDLLWTLQAGTAKRLLKDYASSTSYFDKAEDFLKFYDLRFSAADDMAAIAVNDNIVPYKGQEYDGVMANTYKALNFMSQGKFDLAQVEFNRAIDRQRRTKEKFEKEIKQVKDRLDKAQYGSLAKSSLENPTLTQTLHNRYPQLYEYQAYKDYTNPFVTYLASVYFNGTGRPSKARDLLKETWGLVPDNQYVAQEFDETDKLLGKNESFKNTVWFIFENGLGPVKSEFRIDLPLFLVTNRIQYVGIALPRLDYREIAFPYLQIESDNVKYDTAVVCNMDRVIHSEFKKDFDAALTRAIISTTAKAAAQYAFTNQNSNGATIASIMVAAYSLATNAADVRIWTSLPKDFQIARFPVPQNKILKVTPVGSEPFDIRIPDCNNVLVYVKIIQRYSKPVCYVIPF